MSEFTHFNRDGRARMVDVSEKEKTIRTAKAVAKVKLNRQTFEKLVNGDIKKGDVLAVSQIAGIMAAKNTFQTIPMCHIIGITGADIDFELDEKRNIIQIFSSVKCSGQTGVEMEALNAVTVAALTIYDMCKALQKDILITDIRLLEKTGGRSGEYKWQE